jgi:hypothetical protein
MDRGLMRRAFTAVALVLALASAAGACTTTTVESSTDNSTGNSTEDRPVDLLHDSGALRRAIRAIEARIGAHPARVSDVDVYGEYVIVEAQDPEVVDHIDRYTWRDDEVSPPEPVHLSGPQEDIEAGLFPTNAVRWDDVPELVRSAERRLEHASPIRIEAPAASYLVAQRSPSLDGRVTIRINIDGPRRSGSVELTPAGDVLSASVN